MIFIYRSVTYRAMAPPPPSSTPPPVAPLLLKVESLTTIPMFSLYLQDTHFDILMILIIKCYFLI